jgi:UDP-galactopyranose mutase
VKYDWLIVGAGYAGSVLAERLATRLDQRVLVVDRRPHFAGNAHDAPDPQGVRLHHYGAHIFHTNSKRVFDYLSKFTEWRPYEHRVLAMVEGKKIPVPFNLNSLRMMFPAERAERLERLLVEHAGAGANLPILRLRETATGELRELAEYIYENVYLNYTLKQWELDPEELAATVLSRVPVRVDHDDRYFQDTYQVMPAAGYSEMFRRLLDHPNIHLEVGVDFRELPSDVTWERMIFTGPIDEYFDWRHGELPYRSLRFDHETMPVEWFQEVAVVNYPNEPGFTRIIEQKHLTGQTLPITMITREYPQRHVPGQNEAYYPVPREANRELFRLYREEADRLEGRVLFVGRLADYQYYNMDQVAARALMVFDRIAGRDDGDD